MRPPAPGYSSNLGDAMLAGEPLERIKALFLSTYAKNGEPNELTVYIRHESEGRLHCEARVYFPPETADLARQVGATPCKQPSPDNLGVLVSLRAPSASSTP